MKFYKQDTRLSIMSAKSISLYFPSLYWSIFSESWAKYRCDAILVKDLDIEANIILKMSLNKSKNDKK